MLKQFNKPRFLCIEDDEYVTQKMSVFIFVFLLCWHRLPQPSKQKSIAASVRKIILCFLGNLFFDKDKDGVIFLRQPTARAGPHPGRGTRFSAQWEVKADSILGPSRPRPGRSLDLQLVHVRGRLAADCQ